MANELTPHDLPSYKQTSDGTSEINGPLTVKAFHETDVYKNMPISQKTAIDAQIVFKDAEAKEWQEDFKQPPHDIVRLIIQNTKGNEGFEPVRVHVGIVGGDVGRKGEGANDPLTTYNKITVSDSLNLANGKMSHLENEVILNLKGGEPRYKIGDGSYYYPQSKASQENVDEFVKKIKEQELNHQLSKVVPGKDPASLAAALARGTTAELTTVVPGKVTGAKIGLS